MLGAVEAHVLKEMCQSALIILLLNGTDHLRDEKVGMVFGIVVVPDVVGESVVEFADAHLWVGLDDFISTRSGRSSKDESQAEQCF